MLRFWGQVHRSSWKWRRRVGREQWRGRPRTVGAFISSRTHHHRARCLLPRTHAHGCERAHTAATHFQQSSGTTAASLEVDTSTTAHRSRGLCSGHHSAAEAPTDVWLEIRQTCSRRSVTQLASPFSFEQNSWRASEHECRWREQRDGCLSRGGPQKAHRRCRHMPR